MPRFAVVYPALLALALSACLSTSAPRRPALDARFEQRGISEAQVAADLTDFLRRFEGKVSWASIQIQRAAPDLNTRRAAILWRTHLVPASQAAAFQPTASRGLIDLWALVLQMNAYFQDGAGHDLFGAHQAIALKASAELVTSIEKLEDDLPSENTAELKQRLEEWVRLHPMGGDGFSRPSTAPELASLIGDREHSVVDAVREIDERLGDLTNRITVYGDSMPRQARWQGELAAEEMLARPEIKGMFRDLAIASDSLARLAELQEFIGEQVDRIESVAEAERAVILEDVERQRGETLAAVIKEREEVLKDIDRQRLATLEVVEKQTASAESKAEAIADELLASIRETREEVIEVVDQERRRVFADAEKLADHTLEESVREARGLVDHIALRAVQGGAVLIALAFVAAVLYRRLTR